MSYSSLDAGGLVLHDPITAAIASAGDFGEITADGGHVIHGYIETLWLRRLDGTQEAIVELPDAWYMQSLNSVSADGRFVGITGSRSADYAALLVDMSTGDVTKLDSSLTTDERASYSSGPVVSGDGQSVAFTFHDGPVGCQGCSNVWIRTDNGLRLVNATTTGSRPTTGHSELHDVSGDGRYVLFESSSSDLAGAVTPGTHLYRRDVTSGTTESIGLHRSIGTASRATMSDDGRRVAAVSTVVIGGFEINVIAVHDTTTRTTYVLTGDGTSAPAIGGDYPVGLSADGRTIGYRTWHPDEGGAHATVARLPP